MQTTSRTAFRYVFSYPLEALQIQKMERSATLFASTTLLMGRSTACLFAKQRTFCGTMALLEVSAFQHARRSRSISGNQIRRRCARRRAPWTTQLYTRIKITHHNVYSNAHNKQFYKHQADFMYIAILFVRLTN
jgi:hypothetical protein